VRNAVHALKSGSCAPPQPHAVPCLAACSNTSKYTQPHGAHAEQRLQQRRYHRDARHAMPFAQARHVLGVFLAARRHNDQPASASKYAEDLLQRAAHVLAHSRSGAGLLSCTRPRMRRCMEVQWDAPQWTGRSWVMPSAARHPRPSPCAWRAHPRQAQRPARPRHRLRVQLSEPAMQTHAGAWPATRACAHRWMKCMKFTEPSCCSTAPLGRPVLPEVKMM